MQKHVYEYRSELEVETNAPCIFDSSLEQKESYCMFNFLSVIMYYTFRFPFNICDSSCGMLLFYTKLGFFRNFA